MCEYKYFVSYKAVQALGCPRVASLRGGCGGLPTMEPADVLYTDIVDVGGRIYRKQSVTIDEVRRASQSVSLPRAVSLQSTNRGTVY